LGVAVVVVVASATALGPPKRSPVVDTVRTAA
jgi:energy-converting hydrogenase Eha subunit E